MMRSLVNRIERFSRAQDGSFSVEAVVWMPIFAILLAVIMNVTMVFHTESRMLKIVHDANRAFSLGRFADDIETEAFIAAQLAYLDANLTIETSVDSGLVTTLVSTTAAELMPFNFMTAAFDGVNVGVYAQQLIEY